MTLSKIFAARTSKSRCPFVNGSKEPGYRATLLVAGADIAFLPLFEEQEPRFSIASIFGQANLALKGVD